MSSPSRKSDKMKSARPALGRVSDGLSADRTAAPLPDFLEWAKPHACHAELVETLAAFLPRATGAELDAAAARKIGASLHFLQWQLEMQSNPALAETCDRLAQLQAAFQNASAAMVRALDDPRARALLHKAADPPVFGPPTGIVDLAAALQHHLDGLDGDSRWQTLACALERGTSWSQEALTATAEAPQGRRSKPPLEALAQSVADLWERYSPRSNRGHLRRAFGAPNSKDGGANHLIAQLVKIAGLSVTTGAINTAIRMAKKTAREK